MTPASSTSPVPRPAGSVKGRLIQLDCLRGIAILLVLVHHTPSGADLGWMTPIVAPLARFGWSGVDMFFILSGFLVGGLLFKEIAGTGGLDFRTFLIRRGFKIWPSYTVFLLFFVAKLMHRGASLPAAIHAIWPNFLHLQNYIRVDNPFASAPIHTWSLAVEEHFYLLLPLLLLFVIRGGRRERLALIPWIAGVLLVACLGLRLLGAGRPFDVYTDIFPTHLRIDSLFLGVCLSYFYHFHAPLWRRFTARKVPFLVAGLALIAPMLWLPAESPFVFTAGLTMLALGYACLLIAAVPRPGGTEPVNGLWKNPLIRGVAWIGLYSYSIYLWHRDLGIEPAAYWLKPLSHRLGAPFQGIAGFVLAIALSVIAGVLMGKLIEFPALRIREHFFGASKRSPERSAAQAAMPILSP